MLSYYTLLIILSWMALAVLCILVRENLWIPGEDKRRFYLTYGIIALSALAEWTGIQLNGRESLQAWVLHLVKCADYILTPMAGGAIVAQMKLRDKWHKALMMVLLANTVFQIVSIFTDWMIVIDAHNRYSHGPLYAVYILVYLLVIALVAAEFLVYGLQYRRQNRASLYSILLLVVVGIGMQENLGGEIRTAYIAITLGAALMFIHYSEFYQMSTDEHMRLQREQLMTDALSGAASRHAFMKAVERIRNTTGIPNDLAVFTVDINGLKGVNDTLGHNVGDDLIVGAAHCIDKAARGKGKCYRTGGDEFVILGRMGKETADELLLCLERETVMWSRDQVTELSLSVGYALAAEHPGVTIDNLLKSADEAMYAAKAAYYRKNGLDRRNSH